MPHDEYDVDAALEDLENEDQGQGEPQEQQQPAPPQPQEEDKYRTLEEKVNAIGGMISSLYGERQQQRYPTTQPDVYPQQPQRQPQRYIHDLEFEPVIRELHELRQLKQDVHQ